MTLSSMLEDWLFPFPALFLIPLPCVLPKEGQCLWCGSRLCRSLLLQRRSPLLFRWDQSHYELLSHVCTFTESKFTSCAQAETFYRTPGFLYTAPPRVAATRKET